MYTSNKPKFRCNHNMLGIMLLVMVCSCAIIPSRFAIEKHGIISGVIEIVNPQALRIQNVEVLLTKPNNWLNNEAMRLYIKPNSTQSFTRILFAGDYVVGKIKVHTGSTSYTTSNTKANIPKTGFTLQHGEALALGKLRIILADKEGIFGTRILDNQLTITSEYVDANTQHAAIQSSFPTLPALTQREQLWIKNPVTVAVELLQKKSNTFND